MKKFIKFIVVFFICASLCGCGTKRQVGQFIDTSVVRNDENEEIRNEDADNDDIREIVDPLADEISVEDNHNDDVTNPIGFRGQDRYFNDYFGIEVKTPAGAYVLNDTELMLMMHNDLEDTDDWEEIQKLIEDGKTYVDYAYQFIDRDSYDNLDVCIEYADATATSAEAVVHLQVIAGIYEDMFREAGYTGKVNVEEKEIEIGDNMYPMVCASADYGDGSTYYYKSIIMIKDNYYFTITCGSLVEKNTQDMINLIGPFNGDDSL